MSSFEPHKQHFREVLIFCFHLKKTAGEAHQMLMQAYGDNVPTDKSCREWFRRFKIGDFNVNDKPRSGQPKKFEDDELQVLIDEDPCQSQHELAELLNVHRSTISVRLAAMGKIYKEGRWLSYELKERDIERRKTICEILLQKQKRKGFLHRILTGDEKWIYYHNPKRRKSICDPGQLSTSTPKRNIHDKKVMLCIWWDQKGIVYHQLLKDNETITGKLYEQQMILLNEQLKKSGRNMQTDTTKLSYSTITPDHILRKLLRPPWKLLNGMFYLTRLIHRILLRVIITCFDRWHTGFPVSTSEVLEK